MRLTVDGFENRKDKFFFYKLSKRKDAKDFILANILKKPDLWIGNLIDSHEAEEVYTEWSKRQQSLSYTFKNDLDELDDDFNANIVVEDGEYPKLLSLFNRRRVCIETLIIIDELTGCFKYWEKNIRDTIVFPDINKTVNNYKPFIDYDKAKMKKIVLDKYSNT